MSSRSILARAHVPTPRLDAGNPPKPGADGPKNVMRDGATPKHVDVKEQYRACGRELWARFYALCCDRELAWEALQQAFLKLLQQGGVIHNPRAWLLRVGSNWLVDAARNQKRGPGSVGNIDRLIGPVPEPATRLLTTETRDAVRHALSRLRRGEREILVLRYALDWGTNRIADNLGLTPEAVHMRLSRARRSLKELLVRTKLDHRHETK